MIDLAIDEIKFTPIRESNGLIGFVSFVLNGHFKVVGVGVYTKLDGSGYRLTYPNRKVSTRDGSTTIDLFYPITTYCKNLILESVSAVINKLYQH